MILVTGFEPFGGLEKNPSAEVALALAGPDVESSILPVDYQAIGPRLDALLDRPLQAVVLLGVAIGRASISLERVAINHRDAHRPDNAGFAPAEPEIVPGGPSAYFSTLPLERLRDRISDAGHPVEISLSAGAFLCNASFYLARHRLERRDVPCGFIHLPPTPDLACGAVPLALEDQVEAVGVMLGALRDETRR